MVVLWGSKWGCGWGENYLFTPPLCLRHQIRIIGKWQSSKTAEVGFLISGPAVISKVPKKIFLKYGSKQWFYHPGPLLFHVQSQDNYQKKNSLGWYHGLPTRKKIWSDTAPQVVCNLVKTAASNIWDNIKTIYDSLRLGAIIKQNKTLEMHRSEEYDCVVHSCISRARHRSWHVVSPY